MHHKPECFSLALNFTFRKTNSLKSIHSLESWEQSAVQEQSKARGASLTRFQFPVASENSQTLQGNVNYPPGTWEVSSTHWASVSAERSHLFGKNCPWTIASLIPLPVFLSRELHGLFTIQFRAVWSTCFFGGIGNLVLFWRQQFLGNSSANHKHCSNNQICWWTGQVSPSYLKIFLLLVFSEFDCGRS